MRRREFITLLGLAIAVWPLAARAQQSDQLRRIAVFGDAASAWGVWIAAFAERLRELGWIEGRTVAIEPRFSEGRSERVAEAAAEFVHQKADVIVTYGAAALTFKRVTASSLEYRAIVDAGFVLQLDDPGLPDTWDMLEPQPSIQDYKRYAMLRVNALNHALEGIPGDRDRYHICWGSWHGPHTTDIPLRDIVDVMLRVKAQAYSVEAGNVRHEHEYKLWREVRLPDGKILIPGVVSHATNVVEHPELVADRILNYANAVGRENVIAGTDCGLGGRVHPEIAWAKLKALGEGARRASTTLWR